MPPTAVALLGAFATTRAGQPVTGFATVKVRALLAYLAVGADRPHHRETLATLLWPEAPPAAARTYLRQALANLRAVLGDRTAATPLLLLTQDAVQLNPACELTVDVGTFRALLEACGQHAHRRVDTCTSCARRLEQAMALYRGAFLEQLVVRDSAAFEEWAILTRETLHQQALAALGQLAAYAEQRGADAAAQAWVRRQLALDPWREEAHQQLMRVLARSGQRAAALAQYEVCRRVLARELDVAPAAETTALYERIRDRSASPTAVQPRDARPARPAADLPAATTPLLGRDAELTQLADLLALRDCRLVTLVGPGGVGKTRLALHAAAEQQGMFADGIRLVPLAGLSSAAFLVPAIAASLGMTLDGRTEPEAQLLSYLAEHELLLVLDNFEHLVPAAGLLDDLLRRAARVSLLVTSRERLRLLGEWTIDVAGLPYPRAGETGGLLDYSAVQLFMQAARRASSTVALTAHDAPWAAQICRVVEGLPLAIELAATWVRLLSCQEIARDLDRGLDVLSTTVRGGPERHRSVRAVLTHSWTLLDGHEQRVLRQLAVFRGGCERQAAEVVAGASLAALAALVDKSLLRRTGDGRYDLHELVRQFAAEQLGRLDAPNSEAEQTRDRHLVYVVQMAEHADAELVGPRRCIWLDRLDVEYDNIRAALEWCKARHYGELWLRLAATLWLYWESSGRLHEGLDWLTQALEQTRNTRTQDDRLVVPDRRATARYDAAAAPRAHALMAAAQLARHNGDYVAAIAWAEESLAICRTDNDQWGVAAALNMLGRCVRDHGDGVRAERLLDDSLQRYRTLNHTQGITYVLMTLGMAVRNRGDLQRAKAMHEESLRMSRTSGDRRASGWALEMLGNLAWALEGNAARARELLEESLALFREQRVKPATVNTLMDLGKLARDQGDYAAACVWLEQGLDLAREVGSHSVEQVRELLKTAAQQQDAAYASG